MFIFFTRVDKTLIIVYWVVIRHILTYNINSAFECRNGFLAIHNILIQPAVHPNPVLLQLHLLVHFPNLHLQVIISVHIHGISSSVRSTGTNCV